MDTTDAMKAGIKVRLFSYHAIIVCSSDVAAAAAAAAAADDDDNGDDDDDHDDAIHGVMVMAGCRGVGGGRKCPACVAVGMRLLRRLHSTCIWDMPHGLNC